MYRGLVIFLFSSLSLFAIMAAYAGNPEDLKVEVSRKEKDIDFINKRIEEKKGGIEILRNRKDSILDEIHNLEILLEKGEKELTRIEKRQRKTDRGIEEVEEELKALKERQKVIEDSMMRRLAAMYKSRQGGVLRVIFSTQGLNDLKRNIRYIKALVNYDALLLNTYKKNKISFEEEKERLDNYRMEIDTLRKEYMAEKGRLSRQRDQRQSLIKEIERKEGLQLTTLKELEMQSLELKSLIERLREDIKGLRKGNGNISFALMEGKLDMPIDGEIISLYGKVKHPRFKTVTFNKGIEIETHVGAEVKSVFKGEVVYAGWFKGYGKIMIIDHSGGYYTLFGHLYKNLKDVGDTVEKADVVALAGDTGSLKGPVLYFEVRFHGVPKDPLKWIARR